MNVKQRLKLLAVLSVISVLFLIGSSLFKEFLYHQQLQSVESVVEVSKKASHLMQTVQDERTMSAVYLQSKGALLTEELDLKRKLFDEVYEDFSVQMDRFIENDKTKLLTDDRAFLQELIEKLPKTRKSLDRLDITMEDLMSYYTQLIEQILQIVAINAELSPSGELSKTLSAYHFFLKAKEASAMQKALLSSAFVTENYTATLVEQIAALASKERSYLDVFNNLSTSSLKAYYNKKENQRVFSDVFAFVQQAMQSLSQGEQIDLERWFGMTAQKAEIFDQIDSSNIVEIEKQIDVNPTNALYTALIGLFLLVLILWVIFGINKEISRRIHTFDWIIDHQ